MVSDWKHTIQLATEVTELHKRIKDLEEIEEEHRKLNGALRTELSLFYKTVNISEGENPYDDFPDECILCGTKLKEIDNGF